MGINNEELEEEAGAHVCGVEMQISMMSALLVFFCT